MIHIKSIQRKTTIGYVPKDLAKELSKVLDIGVQAKATLMQIIGGYDYKEIQRTLKYIEGIGTTPHTFRYTFATRTIEAGMQPQVLKTILGHSSLAMTMDLYSHVMEDTKVNEIEKIDIAF